MPRLQHASIGVAILTPGNTMPPRNPDDDEDDEGEDEEDRTDESPVVREPDED